jgi:hypothetical protein
MADGVVVVVGARRVRRQQLTQSLRVLAGVEARVLGFILAFAPRSGPGGSYYGYGPARRRWPRLLPGSRHHEPLDLPSTTGAINVVSVVPGPVAAPAPGGIAGAGVVPGPGGIPGAGNLPGPTARLSPGPVPRVVPPVVADLGTADERAG